MAVLLLVFLPLIAAFTVGLFGCYLSKPILHVKMSQFITCFASVISAFLSCLILAGFWQGQSAYVEPIMRWIVLDNFEVFWALKVDALSALMMVVVTLVSSLVHIYSVGYMSDDPHKPRFMAYLSLFTFCMLMLVTSDNLVQMFFGWEGVGLSSYLLIGFWYKKSSASAAAIKAFVVNRVGDVGFALGIFGIFMLFGTVQFDKIFPAAVVFSNEYFSWLGYEWHSLTVLCLLLFIGAMGKSAQLGLHTWLPDAMEGPTPVSALIHAATMVTAGVFMVCRMSPLFEQSQFALDVITVVGASTAFFAATIALTQNDIKRVIAYSTCSQLGYMFFAAGVSAYPAAMFHLFTHAFFKALLFLGAGAVIYALHHQQDMRRMGGVRMVAPITCILMWIGSLALAGVGIPGVFGFAGFYSKDLILEAAYAQGQTVGYTAYWLGVAAAFMTAFYSWRLLHLTFSGQCRGDLEAYSKAHEAPVVMLAPLLLLAVGAVLSGIFGYEKLTGQYWQEFWGHSLVILPEHTAMSLTRSVPLWVKLVPLGVALAGIVLATAFYFRPNHWPETMRRMFAPLYALSYNKWWFDELYNYIFVRPTMFMGKVFWRAGDMATIDFLGPNGVTYLSQKLGRLFSRFQSGFIYHYAFVMMLGVVIFVTWMILDLSV